MGRTCTMSAALLVALTAVSAQAAVISVTGEKATTGSNYNFTANLLDAQPATDPVAGEFSTNVGSTFGVAGDDPTLVFDFGTDFATKTFTEVYLLQGTYSSGSTKTQTLDYFWSDDKAPTFDVGDVAAPDLGLFNYTAYGNSTQGRWDLQFQDAGGVTAQKQYLIARLPDGGSWTLGNFIYEVAFVNSVPEPGSMMLLGAGVLLVAARRRQA